MNSRKQNSTWSFCKLALCLLAQGVIAMLISPAMAAETEAGNRTGKAGSNAGVVPTAIAEVQDRTAQAQAGHKTETADDRIKALAPVKEILSPRTPAPEMTAYKLIKQAFDQNQAVQEFYKGKQSVHLDLRQAVMLALEKNLAIDTRKHSRAYAKAALWEARSVFLPVFSVSYQIDQNNIRNRRKIGWVYRKAQIYKRNPTDIPAPQSPVSAIWWMPQREGGYELDWVYTSKKDKGRNDRQHTITGSISQQLPWGVSLSISQFSYRRDRYYNSIKTSYDHPWTSSVSMSFSTALPFTKDFGPYSYHDQNLKLKHIATDRAAWELKAEINQTLLNVDTAYWNLVESLKILETTIRNRMSMQKVVEQTNKLFVAQRTTAYGKHQVESELERLHANEESAWKDLIQASNRLSELLDYDPQFLLLPLDFVSRMSGRFAVGAKNPVQEAISLRPEVEMAKSDVVSADIMLKYYRNQTRPDIKYSLTHTKSQIGTTIGYETFLKSTSHLFDEDMKSVNHSLTYSYALRNRANHARHRQAQGSRRDAELGLQDVKNWVRQDVENALANLQSTAARLREAEKGESATRKAFEQAQKLQQAGRITEFEIIAKSRDVLEASTAAIQARIAYRRAIAQYLAAAGRIAREYGDLTAQNEFDRKRIALMTGGNLLKFF